MSTTKIGNSKKIGVKEMIKVQLQFFNGCPSWKKGLRKLEKAPASDRKSLDATNLTKSVLNLIIDSIMFH